MDFVKINIPVKLKYSHFESVIITALEGGSNYWYQIPDNQVEPPKIHGKTWTERIAYALFNDKKFKLEVHDCETNEHLGTVTYKSMLKAFKTLPDRTLDIMEENYDADTADTLFQVAVMGNINYG